MTKPSNRNIPNKSFQYILSNIQSNHLNRHKVWLAPNSTILRSLLYPLPVPIITEEEYNYIIAPVISTGLHAIWLSSKLSQTIVYNNKDKLGLGTTNIYHFQETEGISILCKHVGKNTITRKLLLESIEAAKGELGSRSHFLRLPYKKYEGCHTSGVVNW